MSRKIMRFTLLSGGTNFAVKRKYPERRTPTTYTSAIALCTGDSGVRHRKKATDVPITNMPKNTANVVITSGRLGGDGWRGPGISSNIAA
jgi:hypothetical protein